MCGEKRSADHKGAAEHVDKFVKIVAVKHLCPEQVYNADETALYWQFTPRTLTTEGKEKPRGFKQCKDKVIILGYSNKAGIHRHKPLVLRKSKCPRALKGIEIYPVT